MVNLSHDDKAQYTLELEQGRVIGFSANYYACINETWHEVLRIDTAHGHLHRHRFWLTPPADVDKLPSLPSPSLDYADSFEAAKRDIQANWRSYRGMME